MTSRAAISRAKRSMSERWLAKKTCSPRMKKFSSPMFRLHISGLSSTVFSRSSTGSVGLPPVVSWMIASVSAFSRSCSSP